MTEPSDAQSGQSPFDPHPVSRRQVLRYGSASLVALLAACSSDGSEAIADATPDEPGADNEDQDQAGEAQGNEGGGTEADQTEAEAGEADQQGAVAGENCDLVAFPEFQEGPFYLDTGQVRRDVTEGLTGAAMVVRLTLIDAATCQPLTDLPVDIWSAGTDGAYSGVDNALIVDGAPNNEGSTFMRGRQVSDADGVVVFDTLFPGWYPVTPPHFHFTSPFDDRSSFTWQFFIDDDFSDRVYTTISPYDRRGAHTVRSAERDPAMIMLPTGSPEQPTIDATVAIDLASLSDPPSQYG